MQDNNTPSQKFSLNKTDLQKISKGAAIAVSAALLTYIAQAVTQIDFGQWTPMVVTVSSILINAAQKYLSGYKE